VHQPAEWDLAIPSDNGSYHLVIRSRENVTSRTRRLSATQLRIVIPLESFFVSIQVILRLPKSVI